MADKDRAYSVTLVQCGEEDGAHSMGWLLPEEGYEQLRNLLITGMGEPDVESMSSAEQVKSISAHTMANAAIYGIEEEV
jgi:hypothetical protein